MANLTCLQAAVFSRDSRTSTHSHVTYVVINRCPQSVDTSFDVKESLSVQRQATLVSYMCSLDESGRWVPMPHPNAPFPPEPVRKRQRRVYPLVKELFSLTCPCFL